MGEADHVARITVGVATRPHPRESENGDGWTMHERGDVWRLAVIDGLGHGPLAAKAATAAKTVLDGAPDLDPVESIRRCHPVLTGTRGAAVSVASLNVRRGRLIYAGVGNVEARLRIGDDDRSLVSFRGIVGGAVPTVRPFELELPPANWIFIMHSDGVSARFNLERAIAEIDHLNPQSLADALLAAQARLTDDATVLVAMPTA